MYCIYRIYCIYTIYSVYNDIPHITKIVYSPRGPRAVLGWPRCLCLQLVGAAPGFLESTGSGILY